MQLCCLQSDPIFASLIVCFSSSSVSRGASPPVLSFCLPRIFKGLLSYGDLLQVLSQGNPGILLVIVEEFILFYLISITRVARLTSLAGVSRTFHFPASQHGTVAGLSESLRMYLLVRLLMAL